MKIRLKKRGVFGVKRIGLDGKISKIESNDNNGLQVFIRGIEGLGLVAFSEKETEILKEKLLKKKIKEKKK